jgi:lipopolysaccharide/colanic/teichoic acid biosynthesis glycosyltransferase
MELASANRTTDSPLGERGSSEAVKAAGRQPMDAVLRVADLLAAIVLLVLLSPLLAAISIAIRLDSPGSPIFRQRRCGRSAKEFTVLKFRTMRRDTAADPHRSYVLGVISGKGPNGRPGEGNGLKKLENDDRITAVGAFLRRFSLDELPQLWNVLRGEMTLVGPRPPIPYEVEWYPPRWLERFSVKPGLTGLWQVSGRNELDYTEMVELDLEYVQRRSLWLNATILARTVKVVLTGRGAI